MMHGTLVSKGWSPIPEYRREDYIAPRERPNFERVNRLWESKPAPKLGWFPNWLTRIMDRGIA